MRRIRSRALPLATAGLLALGGAAALPAHAAVFDTGIPNGDVIANLWEWNWKSVASGSAHGGVLLVLDVLADGSQGCSAAASGEVGAGPEVSAPQVAADVRIVLLA